VNKLPTVCERIVNLSQEFYRKFGKDRLQQTNAHRTAELHSPVRELFMRICRCLLLTIILVFPCSFFGQSTNAALTGVVDDPSKAVITGAQITAINSETGVKSSTTTNNSGVYVLPGLIPGTYRIEVDKPGFKGIIEGGLVLHVQDVVQLNFHMALGSASETMTVTADQLNINTTDASVSTVVDRQFAENLPLNGRSFQTLIELTPGMVVTPSNGIDGGQFSINGQRPSSNYWMVDGVSANIGMTASNHPGNDLGGAVGSFSALGGTNGLVSVDAMQEFRIQTSTYAPEFGRTPGAQISILTRSGTNDWHGSLFDYFRNDALDANDWFADFAHLSKPQERQNDFGGTLSGPILKNRTFFFFSYEGLRLSLPQVALDTVPDLQSRQDAIPAIQSLFNAYPLDPNQPDLGNGIAQYNASFSNKATLNSYSFRVDHRLGSKLNIFGRYEYAPSNIIARGASASPLSITTPISVGTQTATIGTTWNISPILVNELRFNYSRAKSFSDSTSSNFGGATPVTSFPFPSPFGLQNSFFDAIFIGLKNDIQLVVGKQELNLQRQLNLVDGLAIQKGGHSIKLGVDYRRLTPQVDSPAYEQFPFFFGIQTAEMGQLGFTEIEDGVPFIMLFRNLGLYAQDTWRASRALTLTYGIRWDVDFAPGSIEGPNLPAVTGYSETDLSHLALAPPGTPPFNTTYGNLAPRLGVAYQFSQKQNWQTVFRGGFGVFYDLATSAAGTLLGANYPFMGFNEVVGGTVPLNATTVGAPPITAASLSCCGNALEAFDPHLKLPYTLQWNAALEQGIGDRQSISATYVGAAGKRLLQSAFVNAPNTNISETILVGNTASSSYNALQVQFQRRLNRGLQGVASYTWSHSIDDGSAISSANFANTFLPGGSQLNRGPSDFDIRHTFSSGLTYDVPAHETSSLASVILRGWSAQTFLTAFSAPPVDVSYSAFEFGLFNSAVAVRPDVVPGTPIYLYGSRCIAALGPPCGGGKGFNPAAFISPPLDPNTGNPLRQGDLGRNALRGFGAFQWDLGVHRDFKISEKLTLQFRGEFFNVLNHPNFGPPVGDLGGPANLNPQFGQSQATLSQSLSGAGAVQTFGSGALNSLYQIGGPRSVQLALKLKF